MLAITVHLLDGTYHADPSGNREADAPTAEWCPAPSRALAALVDAGDGPDGPGWEELRQLFAAPPPVVYADPAPHEQAILPTYALTAVTPSTIKPESTDAVRFLGVARPPERPPDMGECC